MKNLFKVIIACLVLISLSTGAFAQVTQEVGMTATVVSNLAFSNIKTLDFGNVLMSPAPATVIATNAGGAGMVTITKSATANVSVTITQGDLTTPPGTGALILPYTLTQELTARSGAAGGTSTAVTTTVPFNVSAYTADTSFDLYIGGTATPVANQQPGIYAGNITVDVTYY